ncbi:MAG: hypothetical protein K0S65_4113 [Labilithrix sp.]|nr:hypothetical protein [Labilithrix sp.]
MLPRRSPVASSFASARPSSPMRLAAAEFVRGTTFGWGRRDLASWLVCHYSPSLIVDAVRDNGSEIATPARLDDESVERLILDARCTVLRLLSDLAWPSQAAATARDAVGAGFVVARRGPRGELQWAAVGRRKMRLADRVSSLFIADALENPRDYRNVSLCRFCGELGFGARASHPSWCEHALRVA